MKVTHRQYKQLLLWVAGILIVVALITISQTTLAGSQMQVEPVATPTTSLLSIDDDTCLSCHGQPGLTLPLEDGNVLELYVNPEDYNKSIHGKLGYACVQCHRAVGEYPHPAYSASDLRDASLDLYQACKGCHEQQYELAQDSVHARALAEGQTEAAICTDCHTAHAVRQLEDPNTGQLLADAHVWIPQTCAKCHSAIYEKYKETVHGSALLGSGNPDVPTCIDCHGVHNIEDPTQTTFRLQSPQICAKCHTDEERMAKYGLSTDVLNTYVADFHGTTVTLFEKISPDAETNKPVCYDCHGIHDIKATDDPEKGLHVKENLLSRCQVCHPDATINFPDSWLSHYIPSPESNPVVYYVNLFYKYLIPTVLGGMGILVALDLSKLARTRLLKKQKKEGLQGQIEPPQSQSASNPANEEDQHGSIN
ncbi:MAG TPA: ammonia-forming cytochrome c nitrite reductase subunit c552 [Anaerolineales bacterium]|nr:ammonia-forming cytochrome c nitrite reductase subunit c552 [Anaerolineales bacterium]